jgi:hypothetical protein
MMRLPSRHLARRVGPADRGQRVTHRGRGRPRLHGVAPGLALRAHACGRLRAAWLVFAQLTAHAYRVQRDRFSTMTMKVTQPAPPSPRHIPHCVCWQSSPMPPKQCTLSRHCEMCPDAAMGKVSALERCRMCVYVHILYSGTH